MKKKHENNYNNNVMIVFFTAVMIFGISLFLSSDIGLNITLGAMCACCLIFWFNLWDMRAGVLK